MLKTFNRLITKTNRTIRTNKQNEWLVIHYVGAVSSAENNAKYFSTEYRGASANYFVDETSIWQSVEDFHDAWHIGAKKYYNGARNSNSIGIEMCCKKDKSGNWYIEQETIENTIWLATKICKKYNIPITHVVRHYDCTHKICPEPFVREPRLWQEFLKRLEANLMEETLQEKETKIKEYYGLDDNTIRYFEFYRYNTALIDKLYNRAKNG